MKRILQDLKNGEVVVAEVPSPAAREGHVLIQTRAPLVSAGTERMLTEFGSASLMGKARQQPERFRQVLAKIKTDGFSRIPGLRLTIPPQEVEHAYYKYYVFVEPESLKSDWSRDRIMTALLAEGIPMP